MKNKPAQKQIKSVTSRRWLIPAVSGVTILVLLVLAFTQKRGQGEQVSLKTDTQPTAVLPSENIALPAPDIKSNTSLESTLKNRRTKRSFLDQSLSLNQVSQMLWAGQGVTSEWGGRTSPSAKSTYPLKLYLVASKVENLDQGQYEYVPGDRTPVHQLKTIKKGDFGSTIFSATNQNSFKDVPALIVLTGNMTKMAQAFGGVAHDKDVYLEAGHTAQNLYLQAESLKIGMVTNSSFNDAIIRNIVSIPEEETIIYLIPLGYPKN